MKCAICLHVIGPRYYFLPVVRSSRLVDGLLNMEECIGDMVLDTIRVCEECAFRQRGVWRDGYNRDLIVRFKHE